MIVLDRARGLTLREIAEEEGVSVTCIRNIEARACRRMKNKGVVVIANME
jgi:DNA-directed RNA polymerase sigma subunit (sigma70/sigma32)